MFKRLLPSLLIVALVHPTYAGPGDGDKSGRVLRNQDYTLYEVNGRPGTSGSRGSDGSSSGADGGNAGLATDGENAGKIDIKLAKEKNKRGVLLVQGVRIKNSGQTNNVSETIRISDRPVLLLEALGGKGGDGGRGGDGAKGRTGSDGSDATRYSSGGRGQDGGRGGDAGEGSSGAKSGDSGHIKVEVSEKDAGLLLLIQTKVESISGGRKGEHGSPGPGGSGGRGGSSYSWTETDYYTDSQGNRQSRTTYHSNPGGSSGSTGPSGSPASGTLVHGKDGKVGSVLYSIIGEDGKVTSADERFKLEILSYELTTDHPDGVLEPGEKVHIKNVRIKNTGKLPTPKHEQTLIFVKSEGWIVSDGIELALKNGLAPGEEQLLTDPIPVQIKNNNTIATNKRFVATETFTPEAFLEDILVKYPETVNPKTITISYPIEITTTQAVSSLKPGETTRIFWKIKNVSSLPLGEQENLKRAISTALKKVSGDLSENSIQLVLDGQDVPGANFSKDILSLQAGDEVVFGGTLTVDKNAKLYSGSVLNAFLNLADIETGAPEIIQANPFEIRVSESYRRAGNANVLLVTNSRTDRADLALWQKKFRDFGITASHWDLSYNGHIDFTKNVDEMGTLLEGMRGKTIILLNNEFTASGKEMNATDFLAKKNFLEAAANYGVNFFVVGGSKKKSLAQDFMLPTTGESGRVWTRIKDVVEAVRDNKTSLVDGQAGKMFETLDVSRTLVFARPKKKTLRGRAEKLQKMLEKANPYEQFVAVYDFEPKVLKSYLWGAIKTWDYGAIEIRQTFSDMPGKVVSLFSTDEVMKSAQFFESKEFAASFFWSLSEFDRNLLFEGLMRDPVKFASYEKQGIASVLGDVVMADFVSKQAPLRGRGVSYPVEEALGGFKRLMEKVATGAPYMNDAQRNMMLEFAAKLKLLARSQVHWYEYLLPFGKNLKISVWIDGVQDSLAKFLIAKKPDYSKFYQERFKSLRTEFFQGSRDAIKARVFDHFTTWKQVDLGAQQFTAVFDFLDQVQTSEKYAEFRAGERQATLAVEELQTLLKQTRCDLVIEHPTDLQQ